MCRSLSRRFGPLLVLIFLSCLSSSGSACAASLSFEEYQSRIAEAIRMLQAGEGRTTPHEGAALSDLFPHELRVTNRRGETFQVDRAVLTRWVNEADTSPEGRAHLLSHLNALSDQVSSDGEELPSTGTSWDRNRVALDTVYSAKEFRHLRESPSLEWTQFLVDLIRRLREWLQKNVAPFGGDVFGWGPYVAYGLLILAGVILVVRIVRRSGPVGWRWRQPGIRDAGAEDKALPVDWHALRVEAEKSAAQGAIREAVRAFFLSVLMEGHGKGWWVYQPEATNTEHLSRVTGPAERVEALRGLTDLYERAWYGLKDPGRDAFPKCREWLHRMEAA